MAPTKFNVPPYLLVLLSFLGAALSAPSSQLFPRQNDSSDVTTGSEAENSTGSVLLAQLRNPAEILAILLIIGGEVVQKAIAQLTGYRLLFVTPVAFSFGWVAFSFTATMGIFGDGILMPRPEDEIQVVDVASGTQKKNESWLLYRLVRDLELRSRRDQHAVGLYLAVDKPVKPGKPKPDWLVWLLFPLVLTGQFVLAAAPVWQHGNWRILMITGIGTLLAALTASLPQWQMEKYDARKNHRSYIVTRGNGHPHSFVILNGGEKAGELNGGTDAAMGFNLEDLAVVRPDHVAEWRTKSYLDWSKAPDSDSKSGMPVLLLTKIAMPALLLGWIFLLITVGGLEEDTWFLFGIGALGMAQNLLVAGVARSFDAHGIPLCRLDGGFKRKEKTMQVLTKVENQCPGAGIRLKNIYFENTTLRRDEKITWKDFEDTLDYRREDGKQKLADYTAKYTAKAATKNENSGQRPGHMPRVIHNQRVTTIPTTYGASPSPSPQPAQESLFPSPGSKKMAEKLDLADDTHSLEITPAIAASSRGSICEVAPVVVSGTKDAPEAVQGSAEGQRPAAQATGSISRRVAFAGVEEKDHA
jgi:hypothetical protein